VNTIVVDASIAVKLLVDEGDQRVAMSLLAVHELVAPEFMVLEVANALWVKVRAGQITRRDAVAAMDALDKLGFDYFALRPLKSRAQSLSFELDASVYDCAYWAICEAKGIPLATADRAFVTKLRRAGRDYRQILLL
jgi:predicted nucleic acid-binding protein